MTPTDDADTPVAEPAVTPPRLHLGPAAVTEIRRMLEDEDLLDEGGLRVRARSGAGCSAPLQFGLVLEAGPAADDVVLRGGGIRIFMDPTSAWSLDGLVIDWVDDPEHGEGFAFRHPRGAGGRSC
jgi:Fe-S cluster assembly iron-binding protein IscA